MATRDAPPGADRDSPALARKIFWAVDDAGGQAPPLVFVLAGYGDAWVVRGLAKALGPEHTVYASSLRKALR